MTSDAVPEIRDSALPTLYPWQGAAWERLCDQLDAQRLPHALLLQGVVDGGLESFALLFARYLLCAAPVNRKPCGVCRNCHWLAAGSHAGFMQIVPETNDKGVVSRVIKVDQIRDMIGMVMQTAMHGSRKVVVIFPAEAMNANAANALLKNLEEPPPHTFFILVSTSPARLMATLRSRCQTVALPLPSAAEAGHWLSTQISDASLRAQVLALAGNNPLQAERWWREGDMEHLLRMEKELHDVLRGQQPAVQLAGMWVKEDVACRVQWWWQWLALQLKRQLQFADAANLPVGESQLHRFMEKLLLAKQKLDSTANPNAQLLLESLLIDWQQLAK